MVDEKYTRCPECQTVYRVTDEQLAARGGSVRCGQCHAVFDGLAELVTPELPEPSQPQEGTRFGRSFRAAASAATAAIRGASSPHQERPPASGGQAGPVETPPVTPPLSAAQPSAPERSPENSAPMDARRTVAASLDESAFPPARGENNALGLTIVVLGVLLVFQVAFHFRAAIATAWPAARPTIVQWCKAFHCAVGTTKEIGDLEIASSGLQADPAHQGLLILTATLRNRGSFAHPFPYLELSLTDPQDQVIVRRALTPAEYAGGTVDIARGIPPDSEVAIRLFIDASATNQAGYRLYLFYG